jgi:hypothetical protein
MNEDYLWDKTGHDPEIEKFENALSGFRYRETLPPALPARPTNVLPFIAKPVPKLFRYLMAAAACLAFLILSFGIWTQFSTRDEEDTFAGRNADKPIAGSPAEKSDDAPIVITEKGEPEKSNFVIPPSAVAYKTNMKTRHDRRPRPAVKLAAVKLTKEEVYAYDQLKLALSITGSKLKLIRDKVESPVEKVPVRKDGR